MTQNFEILLVESEVELDDNATAIGHSSLSLETSCLTALHRHNLTRHELTRATADVVHVVYLKKNIEKVITEVLHHVW